MSFGPQRPGATLEDEGVPVPVREVADTYDTHHLCLRCVHASTCALTAAINSLGAEGQIVISKCAAFFETPTEST